MTGVPPIVHAARRLRRAMSLPEVLLWREFRARPTGLKFRRQHAIGAYVLDFYCASARLAIEIDGRTHDLDRHPVRDATGDAWFAARGVHCVRIAAARVLADAVAVAAWVIAAAAERQASPPLHHASHGPPPRSGEDFSREASLWNT